MALTDYLEGLLPGWMRRPSLAHWRDLALVLGAALDGLVEVAIEGRLASMPGQTDAAPGLGGFESVDALPFIGRDRGITRGLTQTAASYAQELRRWLPAAVAKGTAFEVLHQLRAVLGPNPPMVRLVTAAGYWYTIEPDGSLVFNTPTGEGGYRRSPAGVSEVEDAEAHDWDWGGADPFRAWPIIYAPANKPLTGDGGEFGPGRRFYGEVDGTIGTTATPEMVELILGVVDEWGAGGITHPWIIIAFDPDSFNPLAAPGSPGFPDGTWEDDHKLVLVDGKLVSQPNRLSTARYWEGRNS